MTGMELSTASSVDFEILITVISGVGAMFIFAFGWIIRILTKQNADKLATMKEEGKLRQKLVAHDKDIEFIKKEQDGSVAKLDSAIKELSEMKSTLAENGSVVRHIQTEMLEIKQKLDLFIKVKTA